MQDITEHQSAPPNPAEPAAVAAAPRQHAGARWAAAIRLGLRRWRAALRAAFADAGIELLLIFCWTMLIAAPYADMSSLVAPRGIEYFTLIQTNHVWTRFQECGLCALWNGSLRGGAPAFVDPHASLLHPLVIVTTLLFGVVNGSKLALIMAFFLAGVAQWWLARVLQLGRIARLWSAGMAVAAGFLAAQMSEGLFSMVISTMSCWLVLPPLIMLAQTGRRRAAVALGVTLGLALVAGQGYMQFGLGLIMPAALLLPRRAQFGWGTLIRRYLLALMIALLLAAPFLIPFLHFLPEFHKNVDPKFAGAQPLTYVLFNLVIDNHSFYLTDALGKLPFAFLYANFIGWIPLAFAIWGLRGSRDWHARRLRMFLLAIALIPLWFASGVPLRWLTAQQALPWLAGQISSIRNCSLLAGLAVPPILALAALGLEQLLNVPWLQFQLTIAYKKAARGFPLDLRWLFAIPLALALLQAQEFGKGWIATDAYPDQIVSIVEALRTPDLQWVNTPIGDNPYEEVAISRGLKLAYGFRAWDWGSQPLPQAVLMLSHQESLPDMGRLSTVQGVGLYATPSDMRYAMLTQADGTRIPCSAQGMDGSIDVQCASAQGGELTLAENNWDGWNVQIDGQSSTLNFTPLLAVNLPPGPHTISFRYQPWEFQPSLALCLLGVVLALALWRRGGIEN